MPAHSDPAASHDASPANDENQNCQTSKMRKKAKNNKVTIQLFGNSRNANISPLAKKPNAWTSPAETARIISNAIQIGNGCFVLPDIPNDTAPAKKRFDPETEYKSIRGISRNPITGEFASVCDAPLSDTQISLMTERYENLTTGQREMIKKRENLHWTWEYTCKKNFVEHGIQNPSNKCYLLSAIQLLSHVPALAALLDEHSEFCMQDNCFCCDWTDLQFSGTGGVEHPVKMIRQLSTIWNDVGSAMDQDVEECISKIFERLEMDFKRMEEANPISEIFQFRICHEKVCKSCGFRQRQPNDDDTILKLMPKPDHQHIQEMVNDLFEPVALVGAKCPNCNKKTLENIQYFIKTPNVLLIANPTIVLEHERPAHICRTINLAKHSAMPRKIAGEYELCGYVDHKWLDEASKMGHYYTKVKKYGQYYDWVLLNDSTAVSCKPDHFGQPYLMMYRRVLDCQRDKNETSDPMNEVFGYDLTSTGITEEPPVKRVRICEPATVITTPTKETTEKAISIANSLASPKVSKDEISSASDLTLAIAMSLTTIDGSPSTPSRNLGKVLSSFFDKDQD